MTPPPATIALKKLDHLVLTTAQPLALVAFYQKLGFRAVDAGSRWELFCGGENDPHAFKINIHTLGAELSPHAASPTPGSGDLCFELAATLTLDAVQQHLSTLGLTPELGPVPRHGPRGPMHSPYLPHPDCNPVALRVYG